MRPVEMLSNAIKCYQMLSNAIQASVEMLSNAIKCHRRNAIKCYQMLSNAIQLLKLTFIAFALLANYG